MEKKKKIKCDDESVSRLYLANHSNARTTRNSTSFFMFLVCRPMDALIHIVPS